jgi:hypothetical protein
VELVIDHDEIELLIREALAARGAPIPKRSAMRIQCNHKKGTIKAVFAAPLEPTKVLPEGGDIQAD